MADFWLISADFSEFWLIQSDLIWFQQILSDFNWFWLISADFSWFEFISFWKTDSADFFIKILADFPWHFSALYRTLLLKGRLEFQALWAFSLVSSLLPYFTKFMQKNPLYHFSLLKFPSPPRKLLTQKPSEPSVPIIWSFAILKLEEHFTLW